MFVGPHSEWRNQRFLLVYQFFGKLFFLVTSLYLVYIIARVYARTREKEKAWRRGIYSLAAALVLAVPVLWIFKNFPQDDSYPFGFVNVRPLPGSTLPKYQSEGSTDGEADCHVTHRSYGRSPSSSNPSASSRSSSSYGRRACPR